METDNILATENSKEENLYDDNVVLKRDIAKFLSAPCDKYYSQITDILTSDDSSTHIDFEF